MRASSSMAVFLLGLLIVAPALASPQESARQDAIGTLTSDHLPHDAVIDEIKFVGLHRIAAETAKSRLSSHSGEKFDSTRIAADLRALNQAGWFEDVFVRAEKSIGGSSTALDGPPGFRLEFHVREYPVLTRVQFSGSRLLSQQQIKKLL